MTNQEMFLKTFDRLQASPNTLTEVLNECLAENAEHNQKGKYMPGWVRYGSKVAAAVLAIVFVGVTSVIAAPSIYKLKTTVVEKDVIYFGGYDKNVNCEEDESVHIVGAGTPISVETTLPNDSQKLWTDKSIETYENGDVITKYTFATYEKAIAFFGLNSNFADLPGKEETVNVNDFRKVERRNLANEKEWIEMDMIYTTIISDFRMGSGSYEVTELYVVGAVAENVFLAQNLYGAENERTYVNKNGIEFTLVDGYETENVRDGGRITEVLLGCDHYYGVVKFRGMNEKEMQEVLDCFKIVYVAPEYEHYHFDY